MTDFRAAVADRGKLLVELTELVQALDRRTPSLARAGEARIVQEAAALKAEAETRIRTLGQAADGRNASRDRAGEPAARLQDTALPPPSCPLCHTLDHTVTSESIAAGATWACITCGQVWSASRLQTAAAYAQYAAAH